MMDRLQVAEFRVNFRTLTAPTEVIRYGETIGTWYPGEREELPPVDERLAELEAEIARLKGLLDTPAKVAATTGPVYAGPRPITPVPKPGSKK
jgi:hypothetical protein